MDTLAAEFLLETEESLAAAEDVLDQLERRGATPDDVHALFRSFHRIKGSAGFVGRSDIGARAHEVETMLDAARRGKALDLRAVRDGVVALRSLVTPTADEPALMTKIEMTRIDDVVEILGELMIAQANVMSAPEIAAVRSPELDKSRTHLTRIHRELQRSVLRMRTTPVRALFDRLARAAADLSRRTGKPIAFEQLGGTTEIDRSMLDTIESSLLHLLRNAVDHGIEDDRSSVGKPEVGRVSVSARQEGSSIVIALEDDGSGFEREGIVERARALGAIGAGDLSDAAIDELVLLPGLSTAGEVTDISGRGVGMDVVARDVRSLRGKLRIESIRGRGTKVSIALPITLALLDVMIVSRGGRHWALPTSSILEIAAGGDVIDTNTPGRRGVRVKGAWLPLGALDDVATTSAPHKVLVLQGDAERIAVGIDRVLLQQQIVVKGLPPHVAADPRVAATAVMPDGTVILVADVDAVARKCTERSS